MFPCIALLLIWDHTPDNSYSGGSSSQVVFPMRLKSLTECKELSPDEFERYVESLGKGRNYAALEELCRANLGYAITVYTQILDDKRAILFCKSFTVGSYQWEHAFWGLSCHRKEKVIGYVKEACRTKNPWVRAWCYSLCLKAGWDDLIENAKRDLNDNTPMTDAIGHTLGTRARHYLKALPEVQKQLNRKK